jgi:DNA replication protein DnaC
MTLLLGPPGSGKTTLLLALAGRLDKDLKVCESRFLFTCLQLNKKCKFLYNDAHATTIYGLMYANFISMHLIISTNAYHFK